VAPAPPLHLFFALLSLSCASWEARQEPLRVRVGDPGCSGVTLSSGTSLTLPSCLAHAGCVAGLFEVPARLATFAEPVPQADIDALLAAIEAGEVAVQERRRVDPRLGLEIVERSGATGLLEALPRTAVTVISHELVRVDGGAAHRLSLTNTWTGTYDAWLYTPEGDGPHPGVLGLHGHGEDATRYLALHSGIRYPQRGYLLLVPTRRALWADETEHRVTSELLRAGASFEAVQIFESLLNLRVLGCLERTDPDGLFMVGHSSGAISGNLSSRLAVELVAYASDYRSTYVHHIRPGQYTDEVTPALFALQERISDFSTHPLPVLQYRYGSDASVEGVDLILDFFDDLRTTADAEIQPGPP